MKKFLIFLIILISALLLVLLVNTWRLPSRQYSLKAQPRIEIEENVIQRLAESVRIKTISYDSSITINQSEMLRLHQFLEQNYPLCDSLLDKEVINSYSLLYTWKGKNLRLKPVILLAHMDVVPATQNWEVDAFSGTIKNNFIWGRGTLDDKVSVLGIIEAAEKLLANGYKPERTIYFAFGHDEETGGENGAKMIAEYLKKKQVEAEYVLDEGLVITDGIVPGLTQPAALIGIAEKGYMTVKLKVELHGGHSSMPATETAIGVLSNAVSKLEQNKLEARLAGPTEKFLGYIGPEMGFLKKIVFANQWLFGGVILKTYEKTPSGNALIRTTLAPTIITSGIKENVIPEQASAIINLRVLPGDSKENILLEIKNRIEDERVQLEVTQYDAPSEVSDETAWGYLKIDSIIRQVFPNTLVAPSLMLAATDSKHYASITKNIYRFLPIRYEKEDLARLHGRNERISIEAYKDVIRFYYSLFRKL